MVEPNVESEVEIGGVEELSLDDSDDDFAYEEVDVFR